MHIIYPTPYIMKWIKPKSFHFWKDDSENQAQMSLKDKYLFKSIIENNYKCRLKYLGVLMPHASYPTAILFFLQPFLSKPFP